MSVLTFEAAMALVAAAEQRFNAKDYDGAATVLEGILEADPSHYWALLLLARSRREQGNVAAATHCLRSAIALEVPERVAAYFDQAFYLLAEQLLEESAPLIEAALRLPDSNQTQWYKGRLLFLRALVALGEGRADAADAAVADAYRFEPGIDDKPLLFGWVREAILRTDRGRSCHTCTISPPGFACWGRPSPMAIAGGTARTRLPRRISRPAGSLPCWPRRRPRRQEVCRMQDCSISAGRRRCVLPGRSTPRVCCKWR